MLETGNNVPDFTIPTDRGTFTLAENAGRNVVVFFFPRADTSDARKRRSRFRVCLTNSPLQIVS